MTSKAQLRIKTSSHGIHHRRKPLGPLHAFRLLFGYDCRQIWQHCHWIEDHQSTIGRYQPVSIPGKFIILTIFLDNLCFLAVALSRLRSSSPRLKRGLTYRLTMVQYLWTRLIPASRTLDDWKSKSMCPAASQTQYIAYYSYHRDDMSLSISCLKSTRNLAWRPW